MEARFSSEVASIVAVSIEAAVSVFRDVWAKEAPNSEWEEAKSGRIQEIEKCLVLQIHQVFTEYSSELFEENEALRAKVEKLEDVLQKKAGQLEQELEARVGQLGKEMEQLEQELKSISDVGSKTPGGPTLLVMQDASLIGAPVVSVSTSPAVPLVAVKEPASSPPPVSAVSSTAAPGPVSEPGTAPLVFAGGDSQVLFVGVGQVVPDVPAPPTTVSESTQFLLTAAASAPAQTPPSDSAQRRRTAVRVRTLTPTYNDPDL
ncbi:reticulon-4-like [Eleginops maclovinus]|uniref:reticulon-4-like n=1 Tax=Eleginops maclovinus TaxID=56733 RepID=UPI003080C029